ncbi:MAG: YqaJ-like viral recombinase domain protein [Bacteroidetes bacterium ADurb.BinA104]|nr:MAG: YqaJ-like viral recombinase domain protein [Bacteroidetes bacterium ADurb.BinA104]
MKSDLIITRIEPHTDEWYEFRKNGIGGSEIGTILGLNKYDTVVRLFHEKVGDYDLRRDDNEKMFWGRKLEDEIAEVWRYYDGTDSGYIENHKNGRIVRDCRNINGYIVNPRYPWLFASLDRVINIKGGVNFITGAPLTTEGVLEVKTLSYWSSQMWTDGIPISYLAQVHQYMIIIESDYAEIAILQDGNNFRVEKIQRDDELCERIIQISKAFWENRVLPAKEAFAKRKIAASSGNIAEVEKHQAVIDRHEPDPDNSEAYQDFINERFFREVEKVDGNIDQYELCKKDVMLRKISSRIDTERTGIRNLLLRDMNRDGAEMIDFGKLGSITWSERKGAKNKTFTIRIKESPSEAKIESEFDKIKPCCW